MRTLLAGPAIVALAGGTRLRPIVGTAPQLQREVAARVLLKAGDRVEIVTRDGRVHRLVVERIADGQVVGRRGSVPIEDIATIGKREVNLATGAVLGAVGPALLASAVASNCARHSSCPNGGSLSGTGP